MPSLTNKVYSMELTAEIIKVIANGGVPIIIFVIWYITYRTHTQQHTDTIERLFVLIEQDIKYKELLIGILTRLETKFDLQNRRER